MSDYQRADERVCVFCQEPAVLWRSWCEKWTHRGGTRSDRACGHFLLDYRTETTPS